MICVTRNINLSEITSSSLVKSALVVKRGRSNPTPCTLAPRGALTPPSSHCSHLTKHFSIFYSCEEKKIKSVVSSIPLFLITTMKF